MKEDGCTVEGTLRGRQATERRRKRGLLPRAGHDLSERSKSSDAGDQRRTQDGEKQRTIVCASRDEGTEIDKVVKVEY